MALLIFVAEARAVGNASLLDINHNPLILGCLSPSFRYSTQLAQALPWVIHETHTVEEIVVNHRNTDAERHANPRLAGSGYRQAPTHRHGSAPASGPSADDGRHARFDALLAVHLPALSRVAYRFCGHRETAEELVQETLLRAWKHLDQLRDDKAAKGWLFMILRRERARGYARQAPTATDIELERLAGDGFESDTDRMALYEAIEALPAKYRTPLVLFAIGGFDVNEIATDLRLKGATVKTRLFRAREKLRQQLQEVPSP